jgi:molybdate transport system regulatory protein
VDTLKEYAMGLDARFRLRINKGKDIAVGPGKVALLEAIVRTGSITGAAKELKMSYRRAWLLVDDMNRCFKKPVVETAAGGKQGGGTVVSSNGMEIIRLYRHIESSAARAAAKDIATLADMLGGSNAAARGRA